MPSKVYPAPKVSGPISAPRVGIPRGSMSEKTAPSVRAGKGTILSPNKDAVANKGMSSKK